MNRASRAPARDAPFIGAPRFQFVRTLGSGGMGTVHEVFDTERRVRMALKTLHATDAAALLYFKREFRALCDLRHPNLVSLGDLVEAGGQWFFTMELVEGTDFLTHVRPHSGPATRSVVTSADAFGATLPTGTLGGGFDEGRLRSSFRQMAAGLFTLHRAGKLHRDLKPSNVMVTAEDRVVILDFGLVTERTASAHTSRDEVVGTVHYMAPEQAGGGDVGPAADWYAFGTMLYEALTGRLPFEGKTLMEVLLRKKREEPVSPAVHAPDAPRDLVAFCRALLRPDPEERPDEATLRGVLGVEDDPSWRAVTGFGAPEHVFVGRKEELAVLEASFAKATSGRSVAVVVEGESGVGKSALVDAFVRRLRADRGDAVVLRSRCREQEAVSYRAFDGWMDDLSRALLRMDRGRVARIAPRHTGELLALFPCLAAVRALAEAAEDDAEGGPRDSDAQPGPRPDPRLWGFAAAVELLRNVAARKPLVAIIDDVQWADKDSLLLLEDLLAPHHVPRWCLVVTERRGRTEEPCAARRLLRGDVRVLSLRGLGDGEARELARHLMEEGSALSPEAVDEAVADAQGHPLFLTQLVLHVARARPSARGTLTLDDALWAEIASLPATAARVLGVLAVAGSPVALGPLAAASDVSPEVFVDELSRLRAARLARIHGSRRDDTAEPYHDRVRETLLARLKPSEKRGLHGALAQALEATGAEDDRVAMQWRLAGDDERALARAKRALDGLEQSGAFGRAAEMARLVLEVSDPASSERAAWSVRLGENLGRAGRPKEAAEAYAKAAALPRLSKDERIDFERRATEQLLTGGYVEEGTEAARAALAHVGGRMARRPLWLLLQLIWEVARLSMHSLKWTPRAEGDLTAEELRRVEIYWSLSTGYGIVDALRSGVFMNRAALVALAAGEPFRLTRALAAAAFFGASRGDGKSARRLLAAADAAATAAGTPLARFYADLGRVGFVLFVENDPRGALDLAQKAQRTWAAVGRGAGWEWDVAQQCVCWSLAALGEYKDLAERIDEGVRSARAGGNRFREIMFRTSFGVRHLMANDPDEAERDVAEAHAAWLPGHSTFITPDYWALKSLCQIALYRGDGDGKSDAIDALWAQFDASALRLIPTLAAESLGIRARWAVMRAARARHRQDDRGAEAHLAVARGLLRRLERSPSRFAQLDCHRLRLGVAWVERGKHVGAMVLEAYDYFRRESSMATASAIGVLFGPELETDEGARIEAEGRRWLASRAVLEPLRFAHVDVQGAVHPAW